MSNDRDLRRPVDGIAHLRSPIAPRREQINARGLEACLLSHFDMTSLVLRACSYRLTISKVSTEMFSERGRDFGLILGDPSDRFVSNMAVRRLRPAVADCRWLASASQPHATAHPLSSGPSSAPSSCTRAKTAVR